MRIVITGASGNVGTALIDELSGQGHQLVGVVRRPPSGSPTYDAMTWHAADLALPQSRQILNSAFVGADAVVHLAWGFQPSHRPDVLRALGVGGTQRVLDAAAASGVGHVVHMSSVGAYSPRVDDRPVVESYPTHGVPGSPYSQHKAAAERLLDRFEHQRPDVVITRMRPGIIGQAAAGSALLRYSVPAPIPAAVLRHLPVLPIDTSLAIPMVHAVDVARALLAVLESRAAGAFNLGAEPIVTAQDIAAALEARLIRMPAAVLRVVVSAAWHARLLQLDPGWIDLAYGVPRLDSSRARTELGWEPVTSATSVLAEVVEGMGKTRHGSTPVLRARTVGEELLRSLREGPVGYRRKP